MFEDEEPWPRAPRPLVDPPEGEDERRARRALAARIAARAGALPGAVAPGDLSFRSPHERLERWMVHQSPMDHGVDPDSPAARVVPAPAVPPNRVAAPPPGDFAARVAQLARRERSRSPRPTQSAIPRPWYLVRGVPELFARLDAAGSRCLIAGRAALACHTRGLAFAAVDLATDDPRLALAAARGGELTGEEDAALLGGGERDPDHDPHHAPEHVASVGDARLGALFRLWRVAPGDFESMWAQRLELSATGPPTLRVASLQHVLGACLAGHVALEPVDAHVALETARALEQWARGAVGD